MTDPQESTLEPLDAALDASEGASFELTLFVSGASDLSARAIANARRLCETHLDGRYRLSVVDLHENPAAVIESQVLAAPTLVKTLPLPVRRIIGDLSRTDKVLQALGLPAISEAPRSLA